jgi:serine/threonine-protein phosphatase 2A regulatory subunit A
VVKAAVDDPSWRVRLVMSRTYGSFATSFSAPDVSSDIYPGAISLIQDPEPDVRTTGLQCLGPFVSVVGASHFLMELIPVVVQLVEDPIAIVRKTLADVIIDVGAEVGPELVTQHIAEIVMRLISDEDPLVRLRVLKKLDVLASASPPLCTKMSEPLKAMFKDSNWRVRKQLGVIMPAVARHLGPDYFTERFMGDYLLLLKDGVDEVREGCAGALANLVAASNANWVHEKIFPAVRAMATDEFLVRLSMLTALQGLIMLELPERFQTESLALIIGATNDKVPNIRLKAAKVLGVACGFIGPDNSRTRVRPVLAELLNDKDKNVKYFAAESLKSCA